MTLTPEFRPWRLEPMARVALMIEGDLEGILAHWTQGLTTAFMEGQQPVLGCEAQGSRVSDSGIHDHQALLRRR